MHDHRASLTEFDTDYVLTIILLVQNLLDLSSTGGEISTPILYRQQKGESFPLQWERKLSLLLGYSRLCSAPAVISVQLCSLVQFSTSS